MHVEAITSKQKKIFDKLNKFPEFYLVGGTALALQIGHRKSVDLDLFGEIDFENLNTYEIFKNFRTVHSLKTSKNINIYNIDNVKVDFVNYSYPWLQNQVLSSEIRLAGLEDIAAMKLAAITGRGSRKDFIDIYFLLQKYSLSEMLNFYKKKYFDGSEYQVLKSLTYFTDAEDDASVEIIKDISWSKIKTYIFDVVNEHNESFKY